MFFVGTALLEQEVLVTTIFLGIKTTVKLNKRYDEEREEN